MDSLLPQAHYAVQGGTVSFFKWVYAYFKPYKIMICFPGKEYLVEFRRGKISTMYRIPDFAMRGETVDMVWMDEATPAQEEL